MRAHAACCSLLTFLCLLATSPLAAQQGSAPTAEQALQLSPIQPGIEYDQPSKSEAKECTIQPERQGKSTSWVVRDATGRMLRRFADTNADNVVDTWSYYHNGLEVYRDIDSDFDSKADQYRWLQTGGSRWGIDKNQDGKIDRWKQISPQELAEEVVIAIKQKDSARFARLLLDSEEAKRLGMGKDLAKQVADQLKNANTEFRKLASSQKAVTTKSRFVDFGAPKPGVVPSGVDGSTKDITVYENASALVDNGGAPEQVLLGSIFRVGDGWRMAAAPRIGDSGPELASVYSLPGYSTPQAAGQPSGDLQKWMEEFEKLDQQAINAGPADQARLNGRRATLIRNIAKASTGEEAVQWYQQLADLLSAAAQSNGYEAGLQQLAALETDTDVKQYGPGLLSQIRYRRIAAEYGFALRNPQADYGKVQEKWVADLKAFVTAFPQSADAADALLQLGMGEEFAGATDEATKWYQQLIAEYPRTPAGQKGAGALRRLGSIGKPISIKGPAVRGGQIDLARSPYRGKHVVVHYWATWCDPCKDDMKQLEQLRKEYRGKLEVIGVNLDSSAADAKKHLTSTRSSWKHLFDEAGLEGKRASDLGVMTLPLMLLVDDRGNVVNRNLHGAELADELKRVIR